MELEKFISKTISSIENGTNKLNKTSEKQEELKKSDINFDLFVDVKKNTIIVKDAKSIKETKSNLNRIKFSVKYSPKQFNLVELLAEAKKKREDSE